MIDIEDGNQVFIPYLLSQDQLPYSMRYYDPIIAIVQENISDELKEEFNLKNSVAFAIHRHTDLKQAMLEKLGVVDNGKEKKLSYQFSSIYKKNQHEVNHNTLVHTSALQRSKYICIDDNLSKQNILHNMTSKFMGLNKGETKAMNEYFNYIEKEIDLHHKNQLIIKKK